MNSPLTNLQLRARELIQTLWSLERRGQFEEGLNAMSEDWADPNFLPDVTGLPPHAAAELHLRFASLIGYQGHYRKIPDSQLRARDVLTSVLGEFESLSDEEKASECENHIALTYSRTGEYAESRTWLAAARNRPISETNIHRLASIMYEMLINVSEQKYQANVEAYRRYECAFRKWSDDWIGASFYSNAGIGFIEEGEPEQALRCYEEGRFRSERSSIWMYLGSIENERAHVFKSLSRYAEAHRAADRGIEVFRMVGDISREGLLWDTKALILLDEHRYDEALRVIEKAIGLLRDGENKGFYAEALTTEAIILTWLGNLTSAVIALTDAIQLARIYSGYEFAKGLIRQFEKALKEKFGENTRKRNGLETGELSLVLPPPLAGFDKYQGIWINNPHLECAGIEKGSLGILVDTKVQRGDLAAVSVTSSGEIFCGFYDHDFGVVCVEGCDTEPQLFDSDAVTILGKIIGVAREPDHEGRRVVEPVAPKSFPEI